MQHLINSIKYYNLNKALEQTIFELKHSKSRYPKLCTNKKSNACKQTKKNYVKEIESKKE